jgi:hypothetical protein
LFRVGFEQDPGKEFKGRVALNVFDRHGAKVLTYAKVHTSDFNGSSGFTVLFESSEASMLTS